MWASLPFEGLYVCGLILTTVSQDHYVIVPILQLGKRRHSLKEHGQGHTACLRWGELLTPRTVIKQSRLLNFLVGFSEAVEGAQTLMSDPPGAESCFCSFLTL